MFDFIISTLVAMFTNIYIISPYWEKLKDYWLQNGQTIEQVNTSYNILCAASYLTVGLIVYMIIGIFKLVYKHRNNRYYYN